MVIQVYKGYNMMGPARTGGGGGGVEGFHEGKLDSALALPAQHVFTDRHRRPHRLEVRAPHLFVNLRFNHFNNGVQRSETGIRVDLVL